MMSKLKILITIPHFYHYDKNSKHGYGMHTPAKRAAIVSNTINNLLSLFVERKTYEYHLANVDLVKENHRATANMDFTYDIDIVLCRMNTGEDVVDLLNVSRDAYYLVDVDLENPRFLGYACHKVLEQRFREQTDYDYYCYMEDDCVIHDSLFFQKLMWFENEFGDNAICQPHRYHIDKEAPYNKRYTEPELIKEYIGQFVDLEKNPRLSAKVLGMNINFFKTLNPHCGCFFLSANQYARMIEHPDYKYTWEHFVSPLESAATFMLTKLFDVYRVDFSQAAFFELEHGS